MNEQRIPKADYAIIGGSSTFSINFPEDIVGDWYPEGCLSPIKVMQSKELNTPFGKSPLFKLFEYKGKKVLTCKIHGWRKGVSRANSSLQLFWALKQAGVKKIFGEGGVGSLGKRFRPRDLIIPEDFIDLSSRRNLVIDGSHLLIMREPFCPNLRKSLVQAAVQSHKRVFEEGVYICTDGYRFETKAEVNMIRSWGDVVGQSLAPEATLARDIGACYASLQMVVNYAEGIMDEWDYQEFKDIFYSEPKPIGKILLNALELFDEKATCQCQELRKPSLLVSEEGGL